jgi:hypothetical protein
MVAQQVFLFHRPKDGRVELGFDAAIIRSLLRHLHCVADVGFDQISLSFRVIFLPLFPRQRSDAFSRTL